MATKVKIYSDNLYLDLLESFESKSTSIDEMIRYADEKYSVWQLMVIDGYAIQKLKSI